jgi:hypothetical protein
VRVIGDYLATDASGVLAVEQLAQLLFALFLVFHFDDLDDYVVVVDRLLGFGLGELCRVV